MKLIDWLMERESTILGPQGESKCTAEEILVDLLKAPFRLIPRRTRGGRLREKPQPPPAPTQPAETPRQEYQRELQVIESLPVSPEEREELRKQAELRYLKRAERWLK